ncbi:MAG: type II toxin-antitoxin system HicB family antitoxin [Saprospiraceae bacterium]
MSLNYKLLLRKEPEGGYTVMVPALPGCITYGDNVDEAISMAKEAIELYIEELKDHGEPVPDDSDLLEYNLNLIKE